MPTDELTDRYARLVVAVGLNLQPGQPLAISCTLESTPFARSLAAAAYEARARYVDVLYEDQHVTRACIEYAREEDLGWSPPWLIKRLDDLGADGGALLRVRGDATPDLLADLDGERVAASRQRDLTLASRRLTSGLCNWSVVAYPNAGWARVVFGEPALDRLWDAVAHAVLLDEPDPVAAWREHAARLDERAAWLNARGFEVLRYRGPGTDLTVGLLPQATWMSAVETARGISHVANMPTEEVFTVPDARRVSGTIAATLPLQLQGTVVRGLRVRFEEGRAVELHADEGEALIRAHVASDEGSSRLGEVALVEAGSRVGATGVVFFDTLYDENAASHVAFGSAIVQAVPGAEALSGEERHAAGVNQSSLHTDFMVGSRDLEVSGVLAGGEEVPIMRSGVFVLE